MTMASGFGKLSGNRETDMKKGLAVIGVVSLLLVIMVVAIVYSVDANSHEMPRSERPRTKGNNSTDEINNSMKAITAICQPTDYKEACIGSLQSVASENTTDPKELIKLAFNITHDYMKKALEQSRVLKEAEKDPRTSQALENCGELMDYSLDDLENSLKKFGEFDLSRLDDLIHDIKVWLSGSITYQETCLDGFDGAKGDAAKKMKEVIKGSSELTSNVLAIMDGIYSVLQSLELPFFHRRLLHNMDMEDDYPSWVSGARRRLLHTGSAGIVADAVVAQDGSGQFTSIKDAIATIPHKSNKTFVIYIKEGVYKESVTIDKSMWNVMMIGDGPTKTKITGNKNFKDGITTFKTATVAAVGEGFIAKNIGFENTAGPEKHQAVALRVQSDRAIFYNCQMDGYQDTLYAHTHRQFYRDCTISGTIDFIFGDAAVIFQNCKIVVRKPMDNQQNIVTAQGRKDRREPTAIIIQNCTITAEPTYHPLRNKLPTFLGRPWKEYSRTFFFQSQIDDLIQPAGWLPWNGDFALNTCFYSEFDNRGPGSSTKERVKWKCIKTMTSERANKFTVAQFLRGNSWINAAGVPFTPGLLP
ncbi:pectinesterase-like [Magnolia sinica]|uniref:pectinesterase-like n=1 Tax=Magnolia sinica TaxID=86752 RepID=UPI00265A2373|nr:pectinesterase-like [Magnolia sinica]